MRIKDLKRMIALLIAVIMLVPVVLAVTACGEGEHVHVFDKEVTDVKFRKSAATCEEAAVYYKSCECGEAGTETFTYGSPAGHDYRLSLTGDYKTDYLTGEDFDTTGLTVTRTCLSCGDTSVITDYEILPEGSLTSDTSFVTIKAGDVTEMLSVKVRSATVNDAKLTVSDGKVIYSLSGICVGDLTSEQLWFDLNMFDGYVYHVEQEDVTIDKTETETEGVYEYTMSADVTDIPACQTAFYPHLHVDGIVDDVVSFTQDWNQTVTLGDSEYTIYHNNDQSTYPYAMPVVLRKYVGDLIPMENPDRNTSMEGPWYTYDKVSLESDETDVWMVIEGRQSGCTYEALSAVWNVQVRLWADNMRTFREDGVLEMTEDGYKAKIAVTNLAYTGDTPYYTRRLVYKAYGDYLEDNYNRDLDVEAGLQKEDVDTTPVTLGNKTYTLMYEAIDSIEDATIAYGNVGLIVE